MEKRCPEDRKVDQPPTGADKRCHAVDQDKVAQVISTELRFKTVRCMAKGRSHHACIGDDDVKRLALG